MTNPRGDLMALAPCPFCGGEAERINIPTVGSDPELGGDPNAGGSCISCKRCAASTALHFDRKENLYSSWNDRAASRSAPIDREAVAHEIGYRFATLVSRDNQPHMSGDPRARLLPHIRRRFDEACNETADAILSLFRPAKAWDSATSPGMTDLMISPESLDAVGEPVAWRLVPIEPTHEQLDAIVEECRAAWGVGNLPKPAPMMAKHEWRERAKPFYRAALKSAPHPPTSPDTSAKEMRDACELIATTEKNQRLREINEASGPNARGMISAQAFTASKIAAAIRQLPTPERGDK